MKTFILFLFILLTCKNGYAQGAYCSKADAAEAERTVSNLDSWQKVYKSFIRFGCCDDGAIAEGYSESVVHLLSSQWEQLEELNKTVLSDSDFLSFVIRHVDASADESELKEVLDNSNKHCPKSAENLCSAIEIVARKALAEIQMRSSGVNRKREKGRDTSQ